MNSSREQFITLVEQGALSTENIAAALEVAKITPDGKAWRTFIDHLLLWLGGLALAFAILFFVAYNWNEFGRFAKFGLVEVLLVATLVVYWIVHEHKAAGKVALLVATILLGVLLALYGQTYQTGADPWQLFFAWSMLMLPWAIIGRFAAIWILWLGLINLSIILYYQTFRGILWFYPESGSAVLWFTFALNTAALLIWEWFSTRWNFLSERWAIRVLGVASGVPICFLAMEAIFDSTRSSPVAGLVWMVWLVAMYFIYRRVKPDLFMLAGACLSGTVVAVAFVSRHIVHGFSAGSFLVLALLVIGMGTGAAVWLRNVHREWSS